MPAAFYYDLGSPYAYLAAERIHRVFDEAGAELFRRTHEMGIKCTADFDRGQFNTAISAVMELVNDASAYLNKVAEDQRDGALCAFVARCIVSMLSPICPH